MTIRLLPHHLLCALTFVGKGYTPAFIRNFEEVLERLQKDGAMVEIVDGPDDICAALAAEPDCHCRNASVTARDRDAANALSGLLQLPMRVGDQLRLGSDRIHALREAFAAGTIRQACNGCQWKPLCDTIVQNGFKDTRLAALETPKTSQSN